MLSHRLVAISPGGLIASLRRSHALKLAASLAMLVLCVLFSAELLSLRGNPALERQNARKMVAESLAVQLSTLASVANEQALQHAVSEFVSRNDEVLAAQLLQSGGGIRASRGNPALLKVSKDGRSSATRMNVPLYEGELVWGEVRIAFEDMGSFRQDALYFSFLGIGCLIVFVLFLRRVLMQLDPSRAVPGRVNTAFNLFSEGVVIMDDELRILLTNNAAATMIGDTAESQLGKTLDDWPWVRGQDWQAPWWVAVQTGLDSAEHELHLDSLEGQRLVVVSCTLVGGADESRRGVMVTLNDRSALQEKNSQLFSTLQDLSRSKRELAQKNQELVSLASTDPLSGLMNRRAFMESFKALHELATDSRSSLVCLMLDIDHFKSINDTYGHGVGDDVICAVAACISEAAREGDIVGRYGGEEFVVVLPDTSISTAAEVAERMRLAIMELSDGDALPMAHLSCSLGVADYQPEVQSISTDSLLDLADKALYSAKESGRNRVVCYDPDTLILLAASKELSADEVLRLQGVTEAAEYLTVHSQTSAQLPVPLPVSENAVVPNAAESSADIIQAILQRHRDELEMLKSHDLLTRLPKRQLFIQAVENEIARASRAGTVVGIISIEIKDIHRFAASLGHAQSDLMIKQIVDHVQEGLRVSDRVALIENEHSLSYLNENHFGILLSDLADIDHVLPALVRVRRLLLDPVVLSGESQYPGFNMGIAVYPDCGDTAAELIESASDARLQSAKLLEKVAYHFASNDVADKSRNYLSLESDLYKALAHHELQVYFQPKFDLATRRICGSEALVRWFHPTRGFVPPDEFIPMAETNGLIKEIFRQVLDAALLQLAKWDLQGIPRMSVSVNLSAAQLRDRHLVGIVQTSLSEAGLTPDRLVLELTETAVMQSPDRAKATLKALDEAGISISMDDFGIGYTSLGLLAELPLSSVKIDRSFIVAMKSSEKSHAIVESVIRMAHALKLSVVAEGVETPEQFATVEALACDEIQGYLISRPLSAHDFSTLLLRELGHASGSAESRKAG